MCIGILAKARFCLRIALLVQLFEADIECAHANQPASAFNERSQLIQGINERRHRSNQAELERQRRRQTDLDAVAIRPSYPYSSGPPTVQFTQCCHDARRI